MSGKKPIGLILSEILVSRKSGVLQIASRDRFKLFYITGTEITEALSNEKGESLEEYLIWRGSVPTDFVEKASGEHKTLEEYIIEKGFLTNSELELLKRTRIMEIISKAFGWGKIDYIFEEGPVEGKGVKIEEALRFALNKLDNRDFYRDYIDNLDVILKASVEKPEGLSSDELIILEDFRNARRISRVLPESPLGEFKTLKIIVFLYLMGMLKIWKEEEEPEEIEVLDEFEFEEESTGRKRGVWLVVLVLILILAGMGWLYYRGRIDIPALKRRIFPEKKASLEVVRPKPIRLPAREKEKEMKRRVTIDEAIKEDKAQKGIAKPVEVIPKERTVKKTEPVTTVEKEKTQSLSVVKAKNFYSGPDPMTLIRQGEIRKAAQIWVERYKGVKGYTLLLELDCLRENVIWAFSSRDKRLFAVPYTLNGRLCYRICFGVFPSKEEALRARKNIPRNFKTAVVFSLEKVISAAPLPGRPER